MIDSTSRTFDVIVLGAGAAGLMCAIEAGKRGRRVAVLDHAPRVGKKILISGGGRCNFTNIHCRAENFISANPHFAKSALARYTPANFIALVEKHGIRYHEKTLGQLFCDHSAQQIVTMLEAECRAAGVQIFLNAHIQEVRPSVGFTIFAQNATFIAPALVVATGGLSIPKIGATDFAYRIAEQFGLHIEPCRPALVPLMFSPEDTKRYATLSGVSTAVEARFGRTRFHEKMLFTHRGLSGPAILQISSYWRPGEPARIDLVPDEECFAALHETGTPRTIAAAKEFLCAHLPQRLADAWLTEHMPPDWTNRSITTLEEQLHNWQVTPAGTEGYAKAEVTAGGISTTELSAKTMESREIRGLFFIGEAVDVTGHLGGFNFQWAWASGFAAGQAC
jgi:predicted Rossmann fold flavoprotein